MKELLQELDQTYNKKNTIILNQNSYYYNVSVPYQTIVKTCQQSNQTIYISISEMPDSWFMGWGRGGATCGIQNIATNCDAIFDYSKIAEVRQKIIEKTGCSNIDVPMQQIVLFQSERGDSLTGVSNTSSGARVGVYQIDCNGNYGYVQGTWQPIAENYYGSVRFFYKLTKEIQTTNTSYKDETRFDSDRYNREINRADKEIADCQSKLNNFIAGAQAQLNAIKSEKIPIETNISSLQNKLNHFNQLYSTRCITNEDLSKELQKQEAKKRLIQQNIQTEQNSLVDFSSQINGLKQKIQQDEMIVNSKTGELALAKEELSESQLKFISQIESISSEQRTYIFAETFGIPEKDFVLQAIRIAGFNAGSLGFYAIEKNNKDLLEVALHYKANFGSYHYDGKSLLQHLIKAGNQDLIDFVLSLENQDFVATLLTAIDQDDLVTLKSILSHNPYLLGGLHDNGYSLLHVAVSLHKVDIINMLLGFDGTLVNIKSTNLESPFTIALRTNIPEVTKLLLPHVNLKHEIELLKQNDATELLKNLNEMGIGLENSNHTTLEQVEQNNGHDTGYLLHDFENLDLIGQFNNYEI